MKIIIGDNMLNLNNITYVEVKSNNSNTHAKITIDLAIREGTPYFDQCKEVVAKKIEEFLRKEFEK